MWGVGPADRTGKSRVTYCPGGRRLDGACPSLFDLKPRVTGESAIDIASGVQSTLIDYEARHRLNACAALQIGKHEWPRSAHPQRIAFHDLEVRTHQWRKVDLVDNEKIGTRDPGASLARDLFATCHIDHVDCQVGKFGTEGRREVVAARLDEAQL